jgi:nitronate monooxygenase
VHPRHHDALLADDGDATVRSSAPDVARQIDWPKPFTIRVRDNAFIRRWHGHEAALQSAIASEAPAYAQAFATGDPEAAAVVYGEAAGLIGDVPSAEALVGRIAAEADAVMASRGGVTGSG